MTVKLDRLSVVWAAGIAVATAGFLSLATWPQTRRLGDLSNQIASEHNEQVSGQRNLQTIQVMQQEVNRLNTQARDLDTQVPTGEMLSAFVEDLARCTKKHGLRSDRIEPGKPLRSSGLVALPITFRVLGRFERVHDLIHDIEQMRRLTQIESFETEADPADPGSVAVVVSLRIFFRES